MFTIAGGIVLAVFLIGIAIAFGEVIESVTETVVNRAEIAWNFLANHKKKTMTFLTVALLITSVFWWPTLGILFVVWMLYFSSPSPSPNLLR